MNLYGNRVHDDNNKKSEPKFHAADRVHITKKHDVLYESHYIYWLKISLLCQIIVKKLNQFLSVSNSV